MEFASTTFANPSAPYRNLPGPSVPGSQKVSETVSKQSPESRNSVFLRLRRLFRERFGTLFGSRGWKALLQWSEGQTYTLKAFSALQSQVPPQAKTMFGVYSRLLVVEEKGENAYTPNSLQGICWGSCCTVSVYIFGRPKYGVCIHESCREKCGVIWCGKRTRKIHREFHGIFYEKFHEP